MVTVIGKLLVQEANGTTPVQTVNSAYLLFLKEEEKVFIGVAEVFFLQI